MSDFDLILKKLVDKLDDSGALKEFRALMMSLAEITSRDMLSANDDNLMHALRGQMRICFELADRASQALEAKEAEAKAAVAERIPDGLG